MPGGVKPIGLFLQVRDIPNIRALSTSKNLYNNKKVTKYELIRIVPDFSMFSQKHHPAALVILFANLVDVEREFFGRSKLVGQNGVFSGSVPRLASDDVLIVEMNANVVSFGHRPFPI